jgi:hypothetical protein
VKISAFAIDGKAPHSDLYVSPAHAIYLGHLHPLGLLHEQGLQDQLGDAGTLKLA